MREEVAPFTSDLIMWGRPIQLFRHLEHQNLSIISEDIGRGDRMVQQFRRRNGGVVTTEEYSCFRWCDKVVSLLLLRRYSFSYSCSYIYVPCVCHLITDSILYTVGNPNVWFLPTTGKSVLRALPKSPCITLLNLFHIIIYAFLYLDFLSILKPKTF